MGVKVVRHNGWRQLWSDAQKHAVALLGGPDETEVLGVIALLDLYGPTVYPPNCTGRPDRVRWATEHMERQIAQPRFKLRFAVHELEAWLLSDPGIFPREVRSEIEKLSRYPEDVNGVKPPAAQLDDIYTRKLRTGYKKRVYGKQLLDKLDPEHAAAVCPSLKALLDTMIELAEPAGL